MGCGLWFEGKINFFKMLSMGQLSQGSVVSDQINSDTVVPAHLSTKRD
jgi:hypothetical protein